MDVCTRVYNQSAISYFKSKNFEAKDDHWVDRLSSDIEIPTQKRNDERRSTKKWALKAFYSDSGAAKHVSTLTAADDDKPSAPSTPARDHKSSAPSTDHQTQTPANKLTQETRPEHSIRFQEYLISSHAEKFKFCLVGKFNHKRPKLSLIRKWASNKWALKGKWSVTLLDPSHVLISLENDDDMLFIWTRQKWIIDGHLMNVFKWSPNLQSQRETSSAAVWVSFPFLPVVFFQEDLLLSIASLVGKVIAVDGQTRNLTRTDVARVWVEVDLCKELPNKLWIGMGNSGFWQAVSYKKLPSYCANCRLQGHSTHRCKLNKNKLYFGIKNRESKVKEEAEDNDDSCRKWAQFRSLFQDVEEDRILSLNLPIETSITKGDGWKKSRTKKIVSNEAFCQRRAEIFNEEEEEEGDFKTEESLRPHLGIEEQGPFPRASNLEQVETKKTMSEEQYSTKAEFNNENEKGRQDQVQKEGDCSDIGKKNLKISSKNQDKNWESIMKENNNKSLEQIAPIRSISTEQQIFRQEKEEKERKERNSSQVEEVISNNDRFPMRIQYMEASNDFEPYFKRYKFADVKKMTKSFRTEIGRGGFGTVSRGKLCDGRVVAVKVLHVEGAEKEFYTELKIIGTTHHVNIVKLLGFCSEFSKSALIYEFMPNGSLDKYIGLPKSLGSKQLHQIAIGVAQGLDYLHNGRKTSVLHLDIKPANILLDKDFCPKICDFGLAKEWKRGEEQPFEPTRGTHGYIAPEHFIGSSISSKSDVYSFGVMLLEMGVGKRILSHKRLDLLTWVRENLNHQQQQGILKDDTSRKMIVVGLWCVQADPVNRPSTGRVVKMLEGKIEDLLPRNNLSICPPPGTTPQFNQKKSYAAPSEIVEIVVKLIAEQAKSRVEGERLRKLYTLKGQVESTKKLKGLDMDTVGQHYSV